MNRKKLFLIDGSALIYRAFFAFSNRHLKNSKGQNTSAFFGTVNSFLKLLQDFDVEKVCISFDRKEPTFRKDISKDYKANRPPMPQELAEQLKPIKDFFDLSGVISYSKAGFEADDILSTLAARYKDKYDIVIVTGDKDFCQIIDDNTTLYDPFKRKRMDSAYVKDKYGIKPSQFLDYLALVGDSADNIPGVKGIGPKRAFKLLSEFSNLEEIFDNIDKISAKSIKNKLENNKDEAFISRKLAKIIKDVPLDVDISKFAFSPQNLKNTADLLKKYEMTSVMKKINKDFLSKNEKIELSEAKKIKYETHLINNRESFEKLIEKIRSVQVVAIDTETTSENPIVAKLVGISICIDIDNAYYISLNHTLAANLEVDFVITKLKETLEDKKLVAHNFKYDKIVLEKYGINFENKIFDTIIASYLIRPDLMRHNLDKCVKDQFDFKMTPISDLIGKGKNQKSFAIVEQNTAARYAAEDAYFTFKLFPLYEKKLNDLELMELFEHIEIPLIDVLSDMERNGVHLNENILKEISKKISRKIGKITKEIYSISGKQFNINSTQQLSKVLFEEMGIKPIKKTKTGYSTNNAVLQKLAEKHHIADLIIEYRKLSKLDSTYVSSLPKLINEETGRIHSSFNQTVASTGRLSSSNPNLQNIPVRSKLGKEIRKAFTGENDNLIIAADYSQIELRLLAILSKDEKLIKAFHENLDIHSQTAAIIFNKNQSNVTSDERRKAKVINFGVLYGMGSRKLSRELKISKKEASEFIDKYFNKFPTIKDYINNQIKYAKSQKYASTIFGRKLFLPDINSRNKRRASEAQRVAVNMPIQGSAADIIKIAMINIHRKIKDIDSIKMLIQVHDELVFEVEQNSQKQAIEIIENEMKNALPNEYKNTISLDVEIGCAKDWFEAH